MLPGSRASKLPGVAKEDAFARSERKVPPRSRAAPPSFEDERVSVLCSCGVVMTLSWRTTEAVRCFGCAREFAPPPTVTATPLRWRPELASKPEHPLLPLARGLTIAGVLLSLLGAAFALLYLRP